MQRSRDLDNVPSFSLKERTFLKALSDCYVLKIDSTNYSFLICQ
jgi:hypothetical protein